MRKFVEPDVADNPLYHDTWKLLKKYRDVVWSLHRGFSGFSLSGWR
mgnify:CR=1 FL=1